MRFPLIMSIQIVFLIIWNTSNYCQAFSPEMCQQLCLYSDTMCWFCTSVHGYENLSTYEESRTMKEYLRPKTKAEMIRKAKSTYSRRQQKIVGGIPVKQGESPWTVSIKIRQGLKFYIFCGGALISDRHVVTSAHCVHFYHPYELFVSVGDWDKDVEDRGEILSAVVKIDIHPKYNSETYEADLAVIELAHRIDFDEFKQPLHLAMPGSNYTNMSMNGTGWGLKRERGESSQRLRRFEVPYVELEDCKKHYDILPGLSKVKLEEGMICAGWPNGGQDACQGDSGGPLVANMPGQFQMLRYSDIQRHLPNQMEDEENELTKPSEKSFRELPKKEKLFWSSYKELPRKERLFWSSGKESAKKIVEAGLEAALYHALTSLQQYHAEHYGGFVEEEDIDDDNQENSPLKPFNNLQNSLLNILRPPKIPEKPQSTYLLQPELYRQEEGVPTLVGLVSWGLGCARSDFPGVYTDIRFYREWIYEKIGGEPKLIILH